MSAFDLTAMRAMLPAWKNAQEAMQNTQRWGNFPAYYQSLSMHANSVLIPGMYTFNVVKFSDWATSQKIVLDEARLLRALIWHDHGEPLTGGDENASNKTKYKGVREWIAVYNLIADWPEALRLQFLEDFSLQFVLKDEWEDLPREGRDIVRKLQVSHWREATIFDFTERWDYFFSAVTGHDQNVDNGEEAMMEHTFGRHAVAMDELVSGFPVLGDIWTPRLRGQLESMAKKASELPVFIRKKA
jgi:hypothetical protein